MGDPARKKSHRTQVRSPFHLRAPTPPYFSIGKPEKHCSMTLSLHARAKIIFPTTILFPFLVKQILIVKENRKNGGNRKLETNDSGK